MHTGASLRDIHERAHRNLAAMLEHCRALTPAELDRALPGFGYETVRLQLHHAIGGQEYWLGVLVGVVDADDDPDAYPDVAALAAWRERVFAATDAYLRRAVDRELNAAKPHQTWGGRVRTFAPAHAVLRTQVHLYHHLGQVAAMCRLLGKPTDGQLDFPLD